MKLCLRNVALTLLSVSVFACQSGMHGDECSPPGVADLTRPVAKECLQIWQPSETGWVGRVDPAQCRIWSTRRETWRRIESEIEVTAAGMWLVERGYDDDMTQAFGTPPGQRLWLDRAP